MKKVTTKKDIAKLGLLTNIRLSNKQIKSLSESMSTVVSYMEEIKTLELRDVLESSSVTEELNIFREDEVETQKKTSLHAIDKDSGYIIAPYVFEKGEE